MNDKEVAESRMIQKDRVKATEEQGVISKEDTFVDNRCRCVPTPPSDPTQEHQHRQ